VVAAFREKPRAAKHSGALAAGRVGQDAPQALAGVWDSARLPWAEAAVSPDSSGCCSASASAWVWSSTPRRCSCWIKRWVSNWDSHDGSPACC
jgi:hypothetical protein